jgi:iron complex transport system permease protein
LKGIFPILIGLLIAVIFWGIGNGAIAISPSQIFGIWCKKLGIDTGIAFNQQQESVMWIIRLPRVLMAILIGSTLSVCGAAMQGLFRNPLADPGLIGISSSASTAAVIMIVVGSGLLATTEHTALAQYSMNIASFLGSLVATFFIYKLSQQQGKTNVSIMLLAGVAINALSGAATGFITLAANDQQLRSITFWMMGSLGGANWINVMSILPFCLACAIGLPLFAKSLNVFSLGERDAVNLGVNTERLKTTIMLLTAMGVGACVAVSGVIGFVGLVVPHILRMIIGPEHKKLLIASALGGAILLILADVISRTVLAPVEIPIGIITALAGGPFFLYLLLKEKKKNTIV